MDPTAKNPLSIIRSTEPQIKSLEDQISKYQNTLETSPTAASSNTQPTYKDLSAEAAQGKLKTQLTALQKKNLTAQWYGADTGSVSSEQGGTPGIIGTALNVLQRPLHQVVKGVKGLIGDKTDVPNQEFTDLLAQHGIGGIPGSILGFTADVALDPVNWLTMGTGALIPRVGVGIAKAGLEGGAAGLTSSLGQKAAFLASHTPFMGGAEGSFAKSLSDKAARSYENYKVLTDTDPAKYFTGAGIARGGKLNEGAGVGIGDITRGILSYVPHGDDLYKSMYYSSRDWLDNVKALDIVYKSSAKSLDEVTAPSASAIAAGEAPTFDAAVANLPIVKGVPPGQEKNAIMDALNKLKQDTSFINENPTKVISVTPEQNVDRLLQELAATDQMRVALAPAVYEFGKAGGPTGIKWYDDLTAWGNNVKVKIGPKEIAPIRVFNDTYTSLIQGVFKPFHTILSPTTWAMNVLSAMPMYMMMGGENALGFMNDYRKAYMSYAGIDPRKNTVAALLGPATDKGKIWQKDVAANNLRAENVRSYMEQFPDTTRRSLTDTNFFIGHHAIQDMVDKSVAEGLYTEAQAASGEAERAILAAHKELKDQVLSGDLSGKPKTSVIGKVAGFLGKKVYNPAETPSEVMRSLRSRVEKGVEESPRGALGGKHLGGETTVAGQTTRDAEVTTELLDKVDAYIKAKAEAGDKPFQIFQNIMDTARAGYEYQDQAFRTAVITQLMNHGISEQGLKVMTRFVNMRSPETQILSTYTLNGQKMYRTSMDYAMEVAHEAAINYGAMPAAIKMVRSASIVGAPFASFGYGMAIKTMQSMAYNPAFFNKVSYGIESASGHKTPLEKEALKSKYYQWYNEPSMLRVPDAANFFSQYPLYLNLSNALPYYSLNIFQPANRSYESVLPNTIVKTLDSLPVLKDPVGQALFDNFILPSIISSTERPMSAIGAPLYPINATAADKAFYAGRGLADALTPAVASIGGLMLPPEYAKYYPGYRTRQLSFGKDAKNALGIPGSEAASSRAIRNILGYLGIPLEQANTSYAASQIKSGGPPI